MTTEENRLHKYEHYSYRISLDGTTVTGLGNYDEREQTIDIRVPETRSAKDFIGIARDVCRKLSVTLIEDTLIETDSNSAKCRILCNENTSSWIWAGGNQNTMP